MLKRCHSKIALQLLEFVDIGHRLDLPNLLIEHWPALVFPGIETWDVQLLATVNMTSSILGGWHDKVLRLVFWKMDTSVASLPAHPAPLSFTNSFKTYACGKVARRIAQRH